MESLNDLIKSLIIEDYKQADNEKLFKEIYIIRQWETTLLVGLIGYFLSNENTFISINLSKLVWLPILAFLVLELHIRLHIQIRQKYLLGCEERFKKAKSFSELVGIHEYYNSHLLKYGFIQKAKLYLKAIISPALLIWHVPIILIVTLILYNFK